MFPNQCKLLEEIREEEVEIREREVGFGKLSFAIDQKTQKLMERSDQKVLQPESLYFDVR